VPFNEPNPPNVTILPVGPLGRRSNITVKEVEDFLKEI
jgi:hypothetical protein